jgi:hypothetical protein
VQDFFEKRPAQALAHNAPYYTHAVLPQSSGKLHRDTHTLGKAEDQFAGRGGRRGELVRHPGDAGSVYGVSTFVDDYARWGTKLAGVPLGETVAKATTRYFDA